MGNKNILVVDDEPYLADVIKDILTIKGYNVSTENNGYNAIDRVKSGFDGFILIDIKMPWIDGITALKTIKSINPNINSLLMTAYATDENQVEAKKMDVDILYKPFDVDDLLRRISVFD